MSTMTEKIHNFVFLILFLVLNLQTCFGNYDCYQLSSGKDICFMLDASQQNFEESKLFCKNNGGFMLEIYNAEMQRLAEQFIKSKTSYLGMAWLNLVRENLIAVWEWGGVGSGKILSYSNWDGDKPASYDGSLNHAFMNSVFKWMNSYNPYNASTICIQGNSEPFWLGSETTSIGKGTASVVSVSTTDSATTRTTTTTTRFPIETESVSTVDNSATRTTTTRFSKETELVPTEDSAVAADTPTTTTILGLPKETESIPTVNSTEIIKVNTAQTLPVESPKQTISVLALGSTTTQRIAIDTITTTKRIAINTITTIAAESPKETVSVPIADSTETRLTTNKTADSSKEVTNSITTSKNISSATATLSQSTTKVLTIKTTTSNSDLESSSAAGVGVGLVGLILIIVSSLLTTSFDFLDEIPLHFKFSKNRRPPPRETGSDVNNNCYEHLGDRTLGERSLYEEDDAPLTNSTLNYEGFQDLIQPNSVSRFEGLSKAD